MIRATFTILSLLLICLPFQTPLFAQTAIPDSVSRAVTHKADSSIAVREDTLLKKKPIFFERLKYRFLGDGNFTRGNVNRSLMVLRAEINYAGPVVSFNTNPRFTYGKQNGLLAERDTYTDLFIDVYKQHRIYGFGLATLETSNLRRIDLRRLAGAGVGLRLWETVTHSLVFTDAIIQESTNFREKPTVTTLRNSARLKGRHSFLGDKIRLHHMTFWQPSLQTQSNVRWNTIISLELPLTTWISVRSSVENSYESVVEAGRKRNDSRITFGFAVGNKK